jgi:hypothetical protein
MAIQVKRFSWVKRPTSWEYAQAWRQHRSNMAQRFLDEGNAASLAFANAQTDLSVGLASLAAQASIQRTQNEIRAAARRQVDLLA